MLPGKQKKPHALENPEGGRKYEIHYEMARAMELANGKWTYNVCPNTKAWVSRKHGEINFYLTQFLTSHGKYRRYLCKIERDTTANCPKCIDVEETAEHPFLACPRFRADRRIMQ